MKLFKFVFKRKHQSIVCCCELETQLVEWSILTTEDPSSNPDFAKFGYIKIAKQSSIVFGAVLHPADSTVKKQHKVINFPQKVQFF